MAHEALTLKFLGHASVLATYQGKSLLFDPWFGTPIVEGVVGGFPAFHKLSKEEVESLIGVHISHVHFDHCCKEDLETIPKEIPIFIGSYRKRDFQGILETLGFKSVNVVPSDFRGVEIGPFRLAVFPKGPEDGSFDSSAVLSANGRSVYLSNDCIHPDTFYFLLRKKFGEFEGAFVGYASVNPFIWNTDYSACEDLAETFTLGEIIQQRQNTAWEHAARVVRALSPRWAVPYASSYRFVTRDAAHLNQHFSPASEFDSYPIGNCKSVLLANGEVIDTSLPAHEMFGSAGLSNGDLPEQQVKPARFEKEHTDAELQSIANRATPYFQEVFQRQAKVWKQPMVIRVRARSGARSSETTLAYDGVGVSRCTAVKPDVEMEFPSGLLEQVLEGKLSLGQAYSTFTVVVRWFHLKFGQMLFTQWV